MIAKAREVPPSAGSSERSSQRSEISGLSCKAKCPSRENNSLLVVLFLSGSLRIATEELFTCKESCTPVLLQYYGSITVVNSRGMNAEAPAQLSEHCVQTGFVTHGQHNSNLKHQTYTQRIVSVSRSM